MRILRGAWEGPADDDAVGSGPVGGGPGSWWVLIFGVLDLGFLGRPRWGFLPLADNLWFLPLVGSSASASRSAFLMGIQRGQVTCG